MFRLIKLLLVFYMGVSFAGMDGKVVEIRGKVVRYNQNYVYLKSGKKETIAPKAFVSKEQLGCKKEIHVFVPWKEYFAMVNSLKKR